MGGKGRNGAAPPIGATAGPLFTSAGEPANLACMKELVRTNDAVVISFVESLLRDAGIGCFVADQNMSVLDGSIGVLPRRVMVVDDQIEAARRILAEAGIANEIRKP